MLKFLAVFFSVLFAAISPSYAGFTSSTKAQTVSAAQYKSMIAEAKKLMGAKSTLPVSSVVAALSGRKFTGRTREGLTFGLTFTSSKTYNVSVNGLVRPRVWTVSNGKYCAGDNVKEARKNCTDRVFKVRGGYVFWQNNKVANAIVAIN